MCVCACVRVWLTFVTKLCTHTVFLLAGGGGGGCHVRKVALAVIRSSAQPRDQGKFHATCATKTPIVNRAAPTVYEIPQAQLRILSIRPMYARARSRSNGSGEGRGGDLHDDDRLAGLQRWGDSGSEMHTHTDVHSRLCSPIPRRTRETRIQFVAIRRSSETTTK